MPVSLPGQWSLTAVSTGANTAIKLTQTSPSSSQAPTGSPPKRTIVAGFDISFTTVAPTKPVVISLFDSTTTGTLLWQGGVTSAFSKRFQPTGYAASIGDSVVLSAAASTEGSLTVLNMDGYFI